MNFNEEKEHQQVEPKYSDLEMGVEIELKKDRLYKLRKNTKIVKPTKRGIVESYFDELDHTSKHLGISIPVMEEFEADLFMTDDFLEDIIEETWAEG